MAWDDDKFSYQHNIHKNEWNGEDIARAARGDPLIEWCGDTKDRNAARVGLENIGGQNQIRTKHLGNDAQGNEGMMRTRGGFPQVTYTKKEDELEPMIPEYMHGKIVDDLLYLYDDYTNVPTGQTFRLQSPTDGWVYDEANGHHRFVAGHTHFIRNRQLNQKVEHLREAVASGETGGSSLLFGAEQYYSPRTSSGEAGLGLHTWLYQAPSGDNYLMRLDYTYPNMGFPAGYRKYASESWTVTTELTARKIFSDGTIGSPVTVFTGQTFTVTNSVSTGGGYVEHDNYVRDGSGYVAAPFEGLNVSPTGDEAILNWLVRSTALSYDVPYFCLKTKRLTITESGGTLSGSWATDLSEDQCYIDTPLVDNSYQETEPLLEPKTVQNGFIQTTTLVPSEVGNLFVTLDVRDETRETRFLLVRGFAPVSGSNTVTGLWFSDKEDYQHTITGTQAGSGTITIDFSQNPITYTGSTSLSKTLSTSLAYYTGRRILKDSTVVAEYMLEVLKDGDDVLVRRDGPDAGLSTGTFCTKFNQYISTVNGVRTVESGQRWGGSYTSAAGTWTQDPQDTVFYGTFRVTDSEAIVALETNNCVSLRFNGYVYVADHPTGPLPDPYDGYTKIILEGLGSTSSAPAARDMGWKLYLSRPTQNGNDARETRFTVSWNPRRPSLFAVQGGTPFLPNTTPKITSVTWI